MDRSARLLASLLLAAVVAACAPVADPLAPGLAPSVAELPRSARDIVDRSIRDLMSSEQVPGLSLGIVSDHRTVYVTGYGLARRPSQPATGDTVYRLASVSKTFTAIAALQLAEQGRLDLDAPVQTYVTTFPSKPWPLSTRQLLGHLGGVRHYRGREFLSTTHYTNVVAPLAIFQFDPLEHEPGTRYLYSTYGYNLVGAVVESAARQPFAEYVHQHVFVPSGMRAARVDDPAVAIPGLATGYDATAAGRLVEAPTFDATNKIPGGGFVASADDMTRYAIAVMSERLLRPDSKQAMWTRQKTKNGATTGYGLGWAVGQWGSELTAAHAGGQPGVSTLLFLAPGRGCAIVLLTNRGGVRGLTDLARGIAGAACRVPGANAAAAPPRAVMMR